MAAIHDLPAWVVGALMLVLFVGASLVGLAVTRRWSQDRGLHALVDNTVIGWIFSAILGIYAIAIGLSAVAAWGNSADATSIASREAAEIAALYRDVSGYPEPIRGRLQHGVVQYITDVIDEAWPLQRQGLIPHTGTVILNDFERILYAFEPATDGQKIVHAEALRAFNGLIELRRQRLEAMNSAVPGTLWSVLLIGAGLSILASYAFRMDSLYVHGAMTSLLAAMIALLVSFIAVIDQPYRGARGEGPEAYELVLRDLIEPNGPR